MAEMFIEDKSELSYRVKDVFKSESDDKFQRKNDNNKGNIYKEKIIINNEQLKNFIELIKKNISKIDEEFERQTNQSVLSSLFAARNQLKDAISILENGYDSVDSRNYDPRIFLIILF